MIDVLIADDEYFFREAMKSSFPWQEHGCRICGEARNGEEALEKIGLLKPDIVLADINMPFLGGLEFIEKAGSMADNPVFIIISGYSEFTYAKEAIRLGVLGYILKPVQEAELADVLDAAADKIRERRKEKTENRHLRAEACGQYMTASRRAGLLVALQRGGRENALSLLAQIYKEDLGDCGDHESCLLTSVEIVKIIMDAARRQKIGLYGERGGAEAAERMLYCLEDAQQIRSYVTDIMRYCILLMEKNSLSDSVRRAIDYIDENYSNPELTVDKIAGSVYLNYYYLCSQFKKETSMTVNHYLMGYRMHRAVPILCKGGRSKEQAAFASGFCDAKYFARCFRKQFGITWRRLEGKQQ